MATKVTVPTLDFSGMYYPEILEMLVRFKRENVPELTDESPYEPFMQLLRAQALATHLSNVLIDLVANESTLATAKLPETVRNMLSLIGYKLRSASPAQVEILYKLARILTAESTEVLPAFAQASTAGGDPVIHFETPRAVTLGRTDLLTACLATTGGAFSDFTDEANEGTSFTPFNVGAAETDALYFGHSGVMWDQLHLAVQTPGDGFAGVWEYHDGEWKKTAPESVTVNGPDITFDVSNYLGGEDRSGTVIRVQLNATGAFEDCASYYAAGRNYVRTKGLLGQSVVDTDPDAYTIGSDWEALGASLKDGTEGLRKTGFVSYDLPQSVTRNWRPGVVAGIRAYWLRYRITSGAVFEAPVLGRARIDVGKQFFVATATQGRRFDEVIGSSNGQPSQRFQTSKDHFIDGTARVWVDDVEWKEVENFIASAPNDRHFMIELGEEDRATVVFGDGVTGAIPPDGVANIRVTYRYGANANGNVGAGAISVDGTGLTYVSSLTNPRPAGGWERSQTADAEALEQAKILGPASLRAKDVAISPSDVARMAVEYQDENGAAPFSRAAAFEEGFGPKTIELVVVTAGGGFATAEQLEGLAVYFNGDKAAGKPKRIVANQEVVPVNYAQRRIDIEATVYGDVEEEAIVNALKRLIQPEARDGGLAYEWDFGRPVPRSRLVHEIFAATGGKAENVVVHKPSADVAVGSRELPVAGSIKINVVK